jgi:regulatory protein
MVITALEPAPRRRSRIQVFVDGVPACEISRATLKQRSLRPGVEVTMEQIDAIVAEDRRRIGLESAVAMLARRPRSEREVRRRLKQRKLDETAIEDTVAKLKGARLLDDAEYARSFAETRSRISPRSRRLLVQELRAAGVESEIAANAVEDVSDEEAAYRLASSRMKALAGVDEQAFRSRLGGLLQRRGFGWDVTRRTVARCWAESHPDDESDD